MIYIRMYKVNIRESVRRFGVSSLYPEFTRKIHCHALKPYEAWAYDSAIPILTGAVYGEITLQMLTLRRGKRKNENTHTEV